MAKDSNALNPDLWVDEYGDRLFAFALKQVRDRELAGDMVQDTLLAALEKRDTFSGKSTELTWLTAILKNKIIDYFRREKRFERDTDITEATFFDAKGKWLPEMRPEDWQESKWLHSSELRKWLNQCIDALSPKTAALIRRKLEIEISSKDLCKEFGLSSSNYWVTLHRARLRLRDCLENVYATKF